MRCLLPFLLAAALAAPALAQGPAIQRVEIDTRNGLCAYALPNSADGVTFEIAPQGRVLFQRRGPAMVSVHVRDASGVSGTRGGNALIFQGGETQKGLTAREARGASSTHEVVIRCCTDRQGNTCVAWSDRADASGTASARPLPPGDLAASGPSAPDAPPAAPLLGPRMEVKE